MLLSYPFVTQTDGPQQGQRYPHDWVLLTYISMCTDRPVEVADRMLPSLEGNLLVSYASAIGVWHADGPGHQIHAVGATVWKDVRWCRRA